MFWVVAGFGYLAIEVFQIPGATQLVIWVGGIVVYFILNASFDKFVSGLKKELEDTKADLRDAEQDLEFFRHDIRLELKSLESRLRYLEDPESELVELTAAFDRIDAARREKLSRNGVRSGLNYYRLVGSRT